MKPNSIPAYLYLPKRVGIGSWLSISSRIRDQSASASVNKNFTFDFILILKPKQFNTLSLLLSVVHVLCMPLHYYGEKERLLEVISQSQKLKLNAQWWRKCKLRLIWYSILQPSVVRLHRRSPGLYVDQNQASMDNCWMTKEWMADVLLVPRDVNLTATCCYCIVLFSMSKGWIPIPTMISGQ